MKTRFCIGVSAAFALACAAFAQPANDLCANATAVGEGSFPFSNQDGGGIFAGTDGAASCGASGNSDIWFMYTPTFTGSATINTCGTGNGDTVLNAFSACGGTELACNDDFCGLRSQITLAVTAGTPVVLRLAEYNTGPTLIDGTLTISGGGGGAVDDECTGTLTALTLGSNATDTTGYTTSADACNFGGPDRWYTFTASSTASHLFSMCGSGYDTVLAVYDACGGTLLGCNDDSAACGLQSQITAGLTAGSTYFVKVDGYGGGSGPGTLDISVLLPPANDNCASADVIAGTGSFPFTTVGATTDGFDSCSFGGAGSGGDVWFAWTPSATDTYGINTCSTGFDTLINVFDTCGGTEVACNDDSCGLSSQVTGTFMGGTTYLVRVANWGTGSGANGNLDILALAPDDECTGTLGALTLGTNATDTTGYTSSGGDCNFGGPDRWYTFTASSTASHLFSMCGSGYDTVIAVFDACGGTMLGCNDDSAACGLQSQLVASLTAGSTYFVKVDGFGGASGPGTLDISALTPPANDNCGSATAISGLGSFPFDTLGATTDGTDSCSFGGAGSGGDVWFAWTAPSTSTFQANTCSTGFDTLVNVFDTCGGTEVACNDDFCGLSSGVSISATGGTTYLIRVANWGTGSGANGNLDILEVIPPANDNCASATAVGEGTFAFDNTFATTDGTDSCSFGGAGSGNDVWFLYTPSFTGTAEVNTCGSTGIGDTVVNVFDACGGTELACNDDFCAPLLSSLFVPVTAGTPVVVRVAGWNAAAPAFGAGSLFIGEAVCNAFDTTVCADTTQDEACFDPFLNPDVTNGGCNSSPEVYSTISCGQTVGGTSSVYDGANPGDLWRDTDWYAFTLTATETVTFTAQAEFDAVMFLIDMNGGCGGAFIVGQEVNQLPCTDMSLTATLNAGSYVAFMGAQFTGANNCDGVAERYWMNMSIQGNSCNCDIDYNNDGLFPDNQDLQDYLDVFGGAACPSACCDSIDFNRDGLFPDNQDLQDFFDVFGGANCPY
ncbi:MAG TPA: hypothetical protein VD971_07555 [Phycisphaerales bacterium]|nr:hypothetical protein [Phycisphaerales bacterium]